MWWPQAEQMEARLLLASSVFIDHSWTSLSPGDDPAGPATSFGTDAFLTIQEGINAVDPSGTVLVYDGTYTENLTINKDLVLISENGRAATTIVGTPNGALGTILVTTGSTAVEIGQAGKGFTIQGIDNPSAGIESAAIYFQGSHSNAKVVGNEVVANGDAGLSTEFGGVNSGFIIDGNIFSGQTFTGANPADYGFANQFTVPNVPRQLVVVGGGAGGGNTSNITFTNNQVTGTAGGLNISSQQQGNTLVTIDSNGATITGNSFTGTTTRFSTSLRARGPSTTISGNTFSSAGLSAPATGHVFVQNGQTVGQVAAANTFDKGVYVDGASGTIGIAIQPAIDAVPAGTTIRVMAGSYTENLTINKNLVLISDSGRAATTIVGTPNGALGTILVTTGSTAVEIGQAGKGFTIQGIDNPSASIESAAIYFQGSHSNAKVVGNEVVANGDAGLSTEFGGVNSGFIIDGNIFSGQTFTGANPADYGFANQFTVPNVPRQLVVMGGGAGGGNTSNITFTNNQVTGTAGGLNISSQQQGNTLVTIDSNGATITGNSFTGTTTRFATSLRARGPSTTISGNTFSSAGLSAPATGHVFVQNTGETVATVAAANTFDKGVFVDGPVGTIGLVIQAAVAAVPANTTIYVLAGTYAEQVEVNTVGVKIIGAGEGATIIDYPAVANAGNAGFYVNANNVEVRDLTVIGDGPSSSAPNYGLKVNGASGVTIDQVTITGARRTGLDAINTTGLTLTNITSHDNGGAGIFLSHVKGTTTLSDITTANNPWVGVSVSTDSQAGAPAGVDNVVITGTNSFGESTGKNGGLQVESDTGNAPLLTWSNTGSDGADVTFQASDFAYALSGPSDTAGVTWVRFYQTLTQAEAAAGLVGNGVRPDHILDTNRYIREADASNGLPSRGTTNYYVYDNAANSMSIQAAIDAAAAGDTVNVQAGNFVEDVSVNKSLSLIGAGASNTTISGPIGGDGATVRASASNVEIAGFTITREGNNTTDWNNGGLNSAGVAIQNQTGMLLHDNIITGNRSAIDVNNSSGNTIRNNVITDNHTGLIFRNQTDNTTLVENEITNNRTVGVLFLDASGGSNSPLQQAHNSTFSNNNISGNWYGQVVDRQAGGSLPAPGTTNVKDFSLNWWGTTTPVVTTANSTEPPYATHIPIAFGGTATAPGGQPDIAGAASANILYSPVLNTGTDTDVETTLGRGTFGFQGDLSEVTFIGTGTDDSFLVTPSGGNWQVSLDGNPVGAVPIGTSFTINGGGGTDDVTIEGTASVDIITVNSTGVALSGSTITLVGMELRTVDALAGNDTFHISGVSTLGGSLRGGDNDDSFVFADGASVGSATIQGGNHVNTLDYSARTTGVTVNLSTGVATGTAGITAVRHVTGGAGGDHLTGDNSANVLTGNAGNDTILGSGGNDTISGGSGTNSLDGGANTDTLVESGSGTITLAIASYTNPETTTSSTLAGIELANLTGGANDDTFIVGGWQGNSSVIDGAGGSDTVSATRNAPNFTLSNTNLTISASAPLTLLSLTLSSIEKATLTGGTASNNFTVSDWTGSDSTISGGGGVDKVIAERDTDFFLSNASLALTSGGVWTLSSVEEANLTGGAGANVFDLNGWTGDGALDGGAAGTDTVQIVRDTSFNLSNGNLTASSMSMGLAGIEVANLTGGVGNNTFTVSNWTGTGKLIGGGGAGKDTVVATTVVSNFDLSETLLTFGSTSLELDGIHTAKLTSNSASSTTFTVLDWDGPAELNGGNLVGAADIFNVSGWTSPTSGSRKIVSSGNGIVNFDASAATSALVVTLKNTQLKVAGGHVLSVSLVGIETANLSGGGFDDKFTVSGWTGVGSLNGNGGTDTVIGKDTTASTFDLTDSLLSLDGGTALSIVLNSIERAELTAGTGDNLFNITGWTGSGKLTGGAGIDTVVSSYASAGPGLSVTLANNNLTTTVNSGPVALAGIDSARITGSAHADVIIAGSFSGSAILDGGDGGDVLTGGSGRNILIGGDGADNLSAGNGDDILIGGICTLNPAALDAVLAAWTSADLYADRVNGIRDGSDVVGGFKLDGTTVLDDGDADILNGGNNQDWFLTHAGDIVTDLGSDTNDIL